MFDASKLSQDFHLSSWARQTDDDWPGVLLSVNPDCRIALGSGQQVYLLQHRGMTAAKADEPSRPVWIGRGFKSLTLLLAKHSASVDGLAAACDGLPDYPGDAYPAFESAWLVMAEDFNATDWRLSDYGRVVLDGVNPRLVVDPSGKFYRLQWAERAAFDAGQCDDWKTVCVSPDLSKIRFAYKHYLFERDGSDPLWNAFDGLPELAADGLWPYLPPRPKTVR